MSSGYLTVAGRGEAEYEDKHSRFIGHVAPASTEAEAKAFVEEIRSQYADATHNVFAYLLRSGDVMRWSDDGEPGGTSGQPTLNVLQGAGISDVCCVTTRYFGGILLGSGGLVRAYSNAVRKALDAAGLARMTPWRKAAFSCGYAQYDKLRRMLEDRGARVENTAFGADVSVIFSAPEEQCGLICARILDATAGEIEVRCADETVFRPTVLEK